MAVNETPCEISKSSATLQCSWELPNRPGRPDPDTRLGVFGSPSSSLLPSANHHASKLSAALRLGVGRERWLLTRYGHRPRHLLVTHITLITLAWGRPAIIKWLLRFWAGAATANPRPLSCPAENVFVLFMVAHAEAPSELSNRLTNPESSMRLFV